MIFDIGPLEMVALAALAVLIFGPERLPKLVSDLMRLIRSFRDFSDSAKEGIRKGLGPEFQDFEFEDLNPKSFVRKQLSKHGDDFGVSELRGVKDAVVSDVLTVSAAARDAIEGPLAGVIEAGQGPSNTEHHQAPTAADQ